MSTETRLAFDHPEARAAATLSTTAAQMLADRISLRDHIVEVEIGAFQAERGTTQRISFNIVVEVAAPGAPLDDDVDRILSYDTITESIAVELGAERLNLLETLAERIADRILAEPQAQRVFVRIEKLDRGPGALGVEIVRTPAQGGQTPAEQAPDEGALHPLVVHFSNAAITGDHLVGWLDALAADPRPVILCVGAGETPQPHSGASQAQRRINLLAIEQNAWVLAGQDRRCVVVDTRTELDWAMKHDQMSVWAPAKMVLDAVDGPNSDPQDGIGLTVWFARQIGASAIITVGGDTPEVAGITVLGADPSGAPLLPPVSR